MIYYAAIAIIVQILCPSRHAARKIKALMKASESDHYREIEGSEAKSSKIWSLTAGVRQDCSARDLQHPIYSKTLC
jgi:hypothetical protein